MGNELSNGKECSRCGKSFNLDNKFFRSLDLNGNPLRADLCEMCEINDTIKEIMEIKHISHKEAEKYLYNYMWDKAYELTNSEDEIIDLWNKTPNISNVIMASEVPNAAVRMVKDNE